MNRYKKQTSLRVIFHVSPRRLNSNSLSLFSSLFVESSSARNSVGTSVYATSMWGNIICSQLIHVSHRMIWWLGQLHGVRCVCVSICWTRGRPIWNTGWFLFITTWTKYVHGCRRKQIWFWLFLIGIEKNMSNVKPDYVQVSITNFIEDQRKETKVKYIDT